MHRIFAEIRGACTTQKQAPLFLLWDIYARYESNLECGYLDNNPNQKYSFVVQVTENLGTLYDLV